MPLDRISRLVRMAAADSGVSFASRNQPAAVQAPLSLTDRQARVLTASGKAPQQVVAPKLFARATLANVTPVPHLTADEVNQENDDTLLPPEGPGQGGQTPAPVIIATGPIPSPGKPAPTPAPSQPAPGPVSQPGPAPFKA